MLIITLQLLDIQLILLKWMWQMMHCYFQIMLIIN